MKSNIENKNNKKSKKGVDKEEILWYNNKANGKSVDANAGVAEQADARDLKSRDTKVSYRFDPGHRHHNGKAGKINIAE